MKIKHTPWGVLASKKPIIAGAAALALVGGIAPALINNTNAYTRDDDDVYYTTVGPYYFTATPNLREMAEEDSDIYMEIEDTRVADWYDGYSSELIHAAESMYLSTSGVEKKAVTRGTMPIDGYFPIYSDDCDYQYACIQGKKVGETQITVYRNGSIIDRYTLKSVKLSPKARRMIPYGRTISETGSLEGEEDDVLILRNALSRSESSMVSIKGEREYKITTSNQSPYGGATLVWTIGNQQVGGGTDFMVVPVSAYDKISESEENEDKLANSTASIFETLQEDEELSYLIREGRSVYGYEINDGSVINWYSRQSGGGSSAQRDDKIIEKGIAESKLLNAKVSVEPRIQSEFVVELTAEEAEIGNNAKNALTEKLPGKVAGVTFSALEANVYNVYYRESGGYDSLLMNMRSGTLVAGQDYEKDKIADFEKLGKAVTVALDTSDAEPVASGMTRTWYVVREADGKVETVSDITYNEKTNLITFETDTFGNYAYGYVDEKTAPLVPDTGTAPEKVAMVATATFAPLAAIALGAFIARSKKKAANKLAKKLNHFE